MSEQRRKKILENANSRLNKIAQFNDGKGVEIDNLYSDPKEISELENSLNSVKYKFADNISKWDDLCEKNQFILESLQKKKDSSDKFRSVLLILLHVITFVIMVAVIFDDLFNNSMIVQKWTYFFTLSCAKYGLINQAGLGKTDLILEWLKAKSVAIYIPCFVLLLVGSTMYKAFKDYSTLIVLYVLCYYLHPLIVM